MFRFVSIIFAAVFLSSAAAAQLPAALDRALSVQPSDTAPERVALRMSVNRQSILVEVRPGEGETPSEYALLQPADEDALTPEQAEMWAGFGGDEDRADEEGGGAGEAYSAGSFDPQSLREAIGPSATLLREGEGRLVYSFAPQSLPGQGGEDDERDALLEHLIGEVEIDAERNEIARVRFDLTESFKPHMAARIREFSMEQRFVHEPALGGPRFSGMTMTMAGSAVFQPFNQTLQIELVSVRYAETDPLEAAPESP